MSTITGTEICLNPETWSWTERPIASQSAPEEGAVHTHYRDERTIRTHVLTWSNTTAVLRRMILQMIPIETGGSVVSRFNWTMPTGETVRVTLRDLPGVLRSASTGGSLTIELEEEILVRTSPKFAGALFTIPTYYTPY